MGGAVEGLGSAVYLLIGAGLFGALVAVLSTRESRNKRYDDSRAADLVRLTKERDDAQQRQNDLEKLNDQLRRDHLDVQLELARTKDALGRATDEIARLKA